MGGAVTAVALWKLRSGQSQDLTLDLRQAIHGTTPNAFWHPTLNGEPPPAPLVADDPFLLDSYRTMDGKTVMSSGVYPHQVVRWCQFLDLPPDRGRVAQAMPGDLEDAANDAALPACIVRTPEEWAAHPAGLSGHDPLATAPEASDASPPLPPYHRPPRRYTE